MIQGATFSMEESERILEIYLKKFDISMVYRDFKRREQATLRQHLKRIIRQTILNIEANLYTANKIKNLTLFDKQSNQMFEAFMNLSIIIPDSEKQTFLLNFRKMKEEGCRMFRKGRTEFYVQISTEEREKIYNHFLKYCEENDLYKYSIATQENVVDSTSPFCDPTKLYNYRDLQLVYRTYVKAKGDLKQMEKIFKQKQIQEESFFGQELEDNLYNLKLIGNYVVYRKGANGGGYEGIQWIQFRDRYPISEDWNYKTQLMLLRIGIRENPSRTQIKHITRLQSRKYIERNGPTNVFNEQDYWKMYFDDVLLKIKGEMQKVMVVERKPTHNEKPQLFEPKDQRRVNSFNMQSLQGKVKFQTGEGSFIDYPGMLDLWREERASDRFTMQKKLFEIAQKHIKGVRNPQKKES